MLPSSNSRKRLLESISEQPPPPCDGCPLRAKCAELELACAKFLLYANFDMRIHWRVKDDIPTRELYEYVFPLDDMPGRMPPPEVREHLEQI